MKFLLKYPSIFKWNLLYIVTNITLLNVVINFILTETRYFLPVWVMFLYTILKDSHGIITKYLIKYYTYGRYMIIELCVHIINILMLIEYVKYHNIYLLYFILFFQILTVLNHKVGSKLVYKMVEKEGFILSEYTISVENIYSLSLIVIGLIMTYITYKFENNIADISVGLYLIVYLILVVVLGKYFKLDRRYRFMKYRRKIPYL